MTVGEAYRKTKDILTEAGFEAPAFEALCLTEKVFGFNRLALITKGEETVASEEKLAVLAELTEKRLNHEPLQYLLGKWSFMGIDLLVGEGVLVPRDDTEVVTSLCIDYLSCKESPNVIDLCAGSGAISLALEKYANCKVTAVELSDKAFSYLTQNIKLNNSAVNALNGDIFECHKDIADNSLDLIVSNPPILHHYRKKFNTNLQWHLTAAKAVWTFTEELFRYGNQNLKQAVRLLLSLEKVNMTR